MDLGRGAFEWARMPRAVSCQNILPTCTVNLQIYFELLTLISMLRGELHQVSRKSFGI